MVVYKGREQEIKDGTIFFKSHIFSTIVVCIHFTLLNIGLFKTFVPSYQTDVVIARVIKKNSINMSYIEPVSIECRS